MKTEPSNKLKRLIRISFGEEDKTYATHPAFEEKSAKQAFKLSIKESITHQEFLQLNRDFLISEGCIEAHIQEQLLDIIKFTKKWSK